MTTDAKKKKDCQYKVFCLLVVVVVVCCTSLSKKIHQPFLVLPSMATEYVHKY